MFFFLKKKYKKTYCSLCAAFCKEILQFSINACERIEKEREEKKL